MPSQPMTGQRTTCYSERAAATRRRRAAKNIYKRPTQLQRDAYVKAMQSRRLYGDPIFTAQELEALATHPFLAPSQRAHYANLAASVNWS